MEIPTSDKYRIEISNRDEYRAIRDEMQRLKNCITTYLGFVLGGFGAALVSLFALQGAMSRGGGASSGVELVFGNPTDFAAVILLFLAMTASMVLHVIFYKFNSHNRYAGYCKLLNQESLGLTLSSGETAQVGEMDVMSWETCVDKLRESDFEANPFSETIENMKIGWELSSDDKHYLRSITGEHKEADDGRMRRGCLLLWKALFGRTDSMSWQFPLYVVRVFFVIGAAFWLLSFWMLIHSPLIHPTSAGPIEIFMLSLYVVFTIIILVMWLVFAGQLFKVMKGSATVDAYCWRFLPLRYNYIKEKDKAVDYKLITLKNVWRKGSVRRTRRKDRPGPASRTPEA